jgi:hypothetical protein
MGTVLLRVVEGDPLRKMSLGRGKLAQIIQGVPQGSIVRVLAHEPNERRGRPKDLATRNVH